MPILKHLLHTCNIFTPGGEPVWQDKLFQNMGPGGGRAHANSRAEPGQARALPVCLMLLKTFVFPGHVGKDAKERIGQATVALQEGFGESCFGEWSPGISPILGHLQVGETITGHLRRGQGMTGLGKGNGLMRLLPPPLYFQGSKSLLG